MSSNISGAILAGGAGKRFNGLTKANLVIGGKTVLSRITDTISDVFDEIMIVTNTPEEFSEFKTCKIISDQFINAGPLGGIHAALKASSNDALFVFAGDMPLLDREFIIRQIGYYNNNKCDILVPRINTFAEPLHSIYNLSVIETLEEYLRGDHNCAVIEFFKSANVEYMELKDSVKNKRMFANVNSPADIPIIEKILDIGL